MSERTFDAALGSRLRRLREQQDLTQEEVARRLAGFGVTTSRVSVSNTENGQRSASAYELTVFPRVLGIPLTDLLNGLPNPEAEPAGPDEATVKAARRLEWSSEEADSVARRLWGHSLTDEREVRMYGAPRTLAYRSRRGHVTRQLIDELRTASAGPARPDEEAT